jgi:hypothetical protein
VYLLVYFLPHAEFAEMASRMNDPIRSSRDIAQARGHRHVAHVPVDADAGQAAAVGSGSREGMHLRPLSGQCASYGSAKETSSSGDKHAHAVHG